MYRFLEEKMRSYESEVALLFETKCVGSIIHTHAHTHVHACIHVHMDTHTHTHTHSPAVGLADVQSECREGLPHLDPSRCSA